MERVFSKVISSCDQCELRQLHRGLQLTYCHECPHFGASVEVSDRPSFEMAEKQMALWFAQCPQWPTKDRFLQIHQKEEDNENQN